MTHPLLPKVDEVLGKLTDASVLLVEAARWADRDRFSFNPAAVLAGPLKYWKWYRAKKRIGEAATLIEQLRARSKEASTLPGVEADISGLDAINDMFDMFPFSIRRVGTPGGPSPIKQQLGVETTVLHQIETTRTTVDHVLSEVGLLHARLRSAQPAAS